MNPKKGFHPGFDFDEFNPENKWNFKCLLFGRIENRNVRF